jgi:parvulin-like peptidyl-prolyl isomerase
LHTGQVSKPIVATGRLHIFLVAERNPGDSMLFEKVKDEIEVILKQKNTDKRFIEWSQELREQANIEIIL